MKGLSTIGLSILLAATSSLAVAAPVGYSVNADSAGNVADSLFRIDLGTGAQTRIDTIKVASEFRIDVEGLAFAPDGTLYGIDDSSMTLFPINPDTAQVRPADEVRLSGLPSGGGNDFGMTFTCDGSLFVTSVARDTLYRLELDGTAIPIGTEGSLGANIGALAAWGEPAQLYGLGNGLDGNQDKDVPVLFRVDPVTGVASEIGPLGNLAGAYAEGGLAFDDSGQLWAITDRRDRFGFALPSEILEIDLATGAATGVRTLQESGFESLAIAMPGGCDSDDDGTGGSFDASANIPGVPALGRGGLALLTLLLLGCGLAILRRP
jgi:hypothetical protein